jgi:hypothetical protein
VESDTEAAASTLRGTKRCASYKGNQCEHCEPTIHENLL